MSFFPPFYFIVSPLRVGGVRKRQIINMSEAAYYFFFFYISRKIG